MRLRLKVVGLRKLWEWPVAHPIKETVGMACCSPDKGNTGMAGGSPNKGNTELACCKLGVRDESEDKVRVFVAEIFPVLGVMADHI